MSVNTRASLNLKRARYRRICAFIRHKRLGAIALLLVYRASTTRAALATGATDMPSIIIQISNLLCRSIARSIRHPNGERGESVPGHHSSRNVRFAGPVILSGRASARTGDRPNTNRSDAGRLPHGAFGVPAEFRLLSGAHLLHFLKELIQSLRRNTCRAMV
jgi:hypothetical protein